MSSTLVNVLIIGAIGVVAWLAIGSPTTIPELKQDIENIKQEFGATTAPQTASGQPSGGGGDTSGSDGSSTDTSSVAPPPPPPPAANASDPGTAIPVPQTSPVSPIPAPEPPALDNSTAPDFGTDQGTAAPPPPLAPAVVPAPTPVLHTPPHAVATTHPSHLQANHHLANLKSPAGHPSHLQAHQNAVTARKVVHNPPHAVAKTHANHEEYGKGYKGTRGYYTFKGHHHCTKGEPGCVCTDPSKCKVTAHGFDKPGRSHYAHAYYTGNMIYSESTPTSSLYIPY